MGGKLVIDHWQHHARVAFDVAVVPDGCRDLIVRITPGSAPTWAITSLQVGTEWVRIEAGETILGWRLRPGTLVDSPSLLAELDSCWPDETSVVEHLHRTCSLDRDVDESLDALATAEVNSVAAAARTMGICTRTLQRTVLRATDLAPAKWLQLARVRRAGRAVSTTTTSLVQLAHEHGYSDQAHMTREFRQWLGTTPARLRGGTNLRGQLLASGYG